MTPFNLKRVSYVICKRSLKLAQENYPFIKLKKKITILQIQYDWLFISQNQLPETGTVHGILCMLKY